MLSFAARSVSVWIISFSPLKIKAISINLKSFRNPTKFGKKFTVSLKTILLNFAYLSESFLLHVPLRQYYCYQDFDDELYFISLSDINILNSFGSAAMHSWYFFGLQWLSATGQISKDVSEISISRPWSRYDKKYQVIVNNLGVYLDSFKVQFYVPGNCAFICNYFLERPWRKR